MMIIKAKFKCATALFLSMLVFSPCSLAQQEGEEGDSKLRLYLLNFGKYFGYDLRQYCNAAGECKTDTGAGAPSDEPFTNRLTNQDTYTYQFNLFNSTLGALLGGSSTQTMIPSSVVPYSALNANVSKTFPNYNNATDDKVTVSKLIDQQTYQSDPVSQSLLNMLTTPPSSFCMRDGSEPDDGKCQYTNRDMVMSQILGEIPKPDVFFTQDYVQQFMSQLNIDGLLTPLMYSSEESGTPSTSSGPTGQDQSNKGLQAKTQAQQAANFIRYVSGLVTPIPLADRADYENYYKAMITQAPPEGRTMDRRVAKRALTSYLTRLRTFAAQNSVGISNLYYILSKRMPQGDQNPSSQALDEFKMATWRILNMSTDNVSNPDNQWVAKINQASGATVQKEIAVLLAEINYQLYLTRQQQERQLLVDTILLLQNSKSAQTQPILSNLSAAIP